MSEPKTVALVYAENGDFWDRCYTWEAGQNYALNDGLKVVAVCDDGYMTKENAQELYDAELARYQDCWGA